MQLSSSIRGTALCFVLSWMSSWSVAALANDAPAVVTLIEGKATLASGIHAFLPVPGAKIDRCAMLRTTDKAMMQLESLDGARIEIGANTHFIADLPAPAGVDPQERVHFLRSGWVKLTLGKSDRPKPQRVQTPAFDMVMESGIAVINAGNGGTLFMQEGKAVAFDRAGAATSRVGVAAGQTYTRKAADSKPVVSDRVDPAFVKAMPPSFRDTVPSLIAGVKGRDVQLKPTAGYDHADILAWQKLDPNLRQCLDDSVIRSAQQALKQTGIDVGPIDGVLGARTQAALREFQKQQNLPQSGQLDEQTAKALSGR